MKTQPESVNVPTAARTIRDEFRKGNPRRLRTIDQILGAAVVHSASTR
jgi:hypothetical protein